VPVSGGREQPAVAEEPQRASRRAAGLAMGIDEQLSATLASVVGAGGVSWRQPRTSAAAPTMITWSQVPNDLPFRISEILR